MIDSFISVGENIHCTRCYKVGGKFVREVSDGTFAVCYTADGEERQLLIPSSFQDTADWQEGKLKHCAVAITLGTSGTDEEKAAGIAYLQYQAKRQEAHGATYLDINVDEYSTDVDERVELMRWTVGVVQDASSLPISVDSSNPAILRAGLEACDKSRAAPMLNSVSLERPSGVDLAAEFGAVVVASAAGETDLPCTTEGRLENLDKIMAVLDAAGIEKKSIHIDPLVFPTSTDPNNGKSFIESVAAVRKQYGPEIHIVAGLSNISFGMPNRKLLNQVFTLLCVEAGADGGIVDPIQINLDVLNGLDKAATPVSLASAALVGEDEFGMNYIMACRDGSLG